jgi:nucleoid-associated protein YgaU
LLYLLFGRGGEGTSSLLPDAAGTPGNVTAATSVPGAATQPATGAQPVTDPQASVSPASGSTAAPAPTVFDQLRYTVVAGDTPSGIAEKVGVPAGIRDEWIQEMLALNGVTETTLQVGQELILPPF